MDWTDFARALALAGSLGVVIRAMHMNLNGPVYNASRRLAVWLLAGVAATEATFWAFVLFVPEHIEWRLDAARWLSRTMDYVSIILLFAVLEIIRQAESKGG